MALTATSLSAPFGKNALVLNATAATGATVGGIYRVNGEIGYITAITGTAIEVRSRGSFGGAAVDHAVLSPLTFGLTTDLSELGLMEQVPVPTMAEDLKTIGADGAIAVPNRNTTFVITKATALASSTLADPSKSQDGLRLTFVSNSAAAHVVTLTNSFDGTTGNSTVYTMTAFQGCSFAVIASKGVWLVLYLNGVTVT